MNQAAKTTPGVDDHVKGPWIEIFVAGTHTDSSGRKMTFTEAHLDEVVASYDPAIHEAPVVVGHPKTDDPALGWISALKRDGKKLYAQERDVAPEFEEMRQRGLYRKRSASFYLSDSPGNPTPGQMHLRHVGNLGAMPPAVKAMADKARAAAFNDDGEGVIEFNDLAVEFSTADAPRWILSTIADVFDKFRDREIERVGAEQADRIIPRWQINSIRDAGLMPADSKPLGFGEGEEDDIADDPNPSPEEQAAMTQQAEQLTAQAQQLKQDQEKLAADKAAFEKQQGETAAAAAAAARESAAQFADQLVGAGKVTPGQRAGVVELLVIADAAQPLSFGEGDDAEEVAAGNVLRELLNGGKAQIEFGERAADGQAPPAVDFSAPAGSAIDAGALDMHQKAVAHQKANPNISYRDAVKAVGG